MHLSKVLRAAILAVAAGQMTLVAVSAFVGKCTRKVRFENFICSRVASVVS